MNGSLWSSQTGRILTPSGRSKPDLNLDRCSRLRVAAFKTCLRLPSTTALEVVTNQSGSVHKVALREASELPLRRVLGSTSLTSALLKIRAEGMAGALIPVEHRANIMTCTSRHWPVFREQTMAYDSLQGACIRIRIRRLPGRRHVCHVRTETI